MPNDPNLHRRRLSIISRLLLRHGAEPEWPVDDIGNLSEAKAAALATAEADRLTQLLQMEAEGRRRVPAPTPKPKEHEVIVLFPKGNGKPSVRDQRSWGKPR